MARGDEHHDRLTAINQETNEDRATWMDHLREAFFAQILWEVDKLTVETTLKGLDYDKFHYKVTTIPKE